jgi:hypothetical protein
MDKNTRNSDARNQAKLALQRALDRRDNGGCPEPAQPVQR